MENFCKKRNSRPFPVSQQAKFLYLPWKEQMRPVGLVSSLVAEEVAARMGVSSVMLVHLLTEVAIHPPGPPPSTVWKLDPRFEMITHLGSNGDGSWLRSRIQDVPDHGLSVLDDKSAMS